MTGRSVSLSSTILEARTIRMLDFTGKMSITSQLKVQALRSLAYTGKRTIPSRSELWASRFLGSRRTDLEPQCTQLLFLPLVGLPAIVLLPDQLFFLAWPIALYAHATFGSVQPEHRQA